MLLLHTFQPSISTRCESNLSVPKWTPPPKNWVMLNVDATIFADSKCMGMGVVITSHIGEFLAACSQPFPFVTDPEIAEAMAMRKAVQFAKERGYLRIITALDCLSLVQKLNNSKGYRSTIAALVSDIKLYSFPF